MAVVPSRLALAAHGGDEALAGVGQGPLPSFVARGHGLATVALGAREVDHVAHVAVRKVGVVLEAHDALPIGPLSLVQEVLQRAAADEVAPTGAREAPVAVEAARRERPPCVALVALVPHFHSSRPCFLRGVEDVRGVGELLGGAAAHNRALPIHLVLAVRRARHGVLSSVPELARHVGRAAEGQPGLAAAGQAPRRPGQHPVLLPLPLPDVALEVLLGTGDVVHGWLGLDVVLRGHNPQDGLHADDAARHGDGAVDARPQAAAEVLPADTGLLVPFLLKPRLPRLPQVVRLRLRHGHVVYQVLHPDLAVRVGVGGVHDAE
mmetsp:Transcript_27385/g.85117  ORF Transcript_27385/g.85117 Transcript_27385/m.85117 type:complete len:321 (-) Transcript_27385:451-1413(-)